MIKSLNRLAKATLSDQPSYPPEADYILQGIEQGLREDARSNLEFRSFDYQTGFVESANGSAILRFGDQETQIICAIKADIQKGERESQTEFFLNAASVRQEELQLLVVNILSETLGKAISQQCETQLSFGDHTFFWKLNIDIMVLDQLDITQLGMLGLVVLLALSDLELPLTQIYKNEVSGKQEALILSEVDPEANFQDNYVKFNVTGLPVLLLFGLVILFLAQRGSHIVADCTAYEWACLKRGVLLALSNDSHIRGIRTFGGGISSQMIGRVCEEGSKMLPDLTSRLKF